MERALLRIVVTVCLLAATVSAQESYTPLATMDGRSFTAQDLPSDVGDAWLKLETTLSKARTDLLELQIDNLLLAQEARKKGVSKDLLIESEVNKKVPDPDEKSIRAVYDENKAAIGDTTLKEIRPQIIKFLRLEPEKKALQDYKQKLRSTAKIERGKPVGTKGLSLNDVLVMVNAEPITYAAYRAKNALALYEYEANVFDRVDAALRMIVDSAVFQKESESRDIAINQLIAAEITSKMKDFSAEESKRLEDDLKRRLYQKYRVKYFIEEPKPYLQNISVDDDPSLGSPTAPVTIVMFTDYECPACAGVHPLLKQIQKKHGDKVRIVYRDFPLEKVHENARRAAIAVNAAAKQNKFEAFAELVYRNQNALDQTSLMSYAKQAGLDSSRFAADLADPALSAEIDKDKAEGVRYGITGTPSIFVNGYKIRSLSAAAFERAIQRALAGDFR